MLCAKFGCNWPCNSREEDFLILSIYFLLHNHLPLEKGVALHLNKLESPSPSTTKLVWNWPSGSWEEVENVKGLQTDRRGTTGDQKSLLKLSAQVS